MQIGGNPISSLNRLARVKSPCPLTQKSQWPLAIPMHPTQLHREPRSRPYLISERVERSAREGVRYSTRQTTTALLPAIVKQFSVHLNHAPGASLTGTPFCVTFPAAGLCSRRAGSACGEARGWRQWRGSRQPLVWSEPSCEVRQVRELGARGHRESVAHLTAKRTTA